MFVYRGKDLINSYLARRSRERFWLDYWFFLNADHTHRLYRTRPIGLRTMTRIACDADPAHERVLLSALKQELSAHLPLFDLAQIAYPDPAILTDGTLNLGREWSRFLERTAEHPTPFWERLNSCFERSIEAADLSQLAFLARRLSSELVDAGYSRRELLDHLRGQLVNAEALCLAGLFGALEEETKFYIVTHRVDPRPIEGARFPYEISGKARPVTELVPLASRDGLTEPQEALVGIQCGVRARSHIEAVEKALKLTQIALDHLRTCYYVRTGLVGPVHVRIHGEEGEKWFALRRPFWAKHLNTLRKAPSLPTSLHRLWATDQNVDAAKWQAVRSHVSFAIEVWAEDVHRAGSSVWQALECVVPNKRHRLQNLILPFITAERVSMATFLMHQYMVQRRNLREFMFCDWPYVAPDQDHSTAWSILLKRESPSQFRSWRHPPAPSILFNEGNGLLRGLVGREGRLREPAWMVRRAAQDLDELYGIRNAVVHRGFRHGSDQWVAHLAEVGLEILFSLARLEVSKMMSNAEAPVQGVPSMAT